MNWFSVGGLVAAVFVASLIGTWIVLGALVRRRIVDEPDERSSHARPTPTGGGIAVTGVVLVAWYVVGAVGDSPPDPVFNIVGLGFLLAGISWIDDLRRLSPLPRLFAQAAAVAAALITVPAPGPYFGGLLSPTLDLVAAGLAWVWFVNLFNFMDGIDGIAGVETISIGVGLAAVAGIAGIEGPLPLLALTLAAAAGGFLWWNWYPARVFLGDVGSVPLGFFLGWLLLTAAAYGEWAAALILPLYFLVDATWTLLHRALKGEAVWRPHRQHFYQMAAARGFSHDRIVGLVIVTNLFLIALAVISARGQIGPGLLGAAGAVGLLLVFLTKADPAD